MSALLLAAATVIGVIVVAEQMRATTAERDALADQLEWERLVCEVDALRRDLA